MKDSVISDNFIRKFINCITKMEHKTVHHWFEGNRHGFREDHTQFPNKNNVYKEILDNHMVRLILLECHVIHYIHHIKSVLIRKKKFD